jgi:hypothetical protein
MKSQTSVPTDTTVRASHFALCTLPSPIQAIGINRNQTEVIGTNSRITFGRPPKRLLSRDSLSIPAIHFGRSANYFRPLRGKWDQAAPNRGYARFRIDGQNERNRAAHNLATTANDLTAIRAYPLVIRS